MGKIVNIDEDLCSGCSQCVDMCPKGILYIDDATGKCKVTDERKCDKLAGCESVCPSCAITISK